MTDIKTATQIMNGLAAYAPHHIDTFMPFYQKAKQEAHADLLDNILSASCALYDDDGSNAIIAAIRFGDIGDMMKKKE